jgi:hypothetical protein
MRRSKAMVKTSPVLMVLLAEEILSLLIRTCPPAASFCARERDFVTLAYQSHLSMRRLPGFEVGSRLWIVARNYFLSLSPMFSFSAIKAAKGEFGSIGLSLGALSRRLPPSRAF